MKLRHLGVQTAGDRQTLLEIGAQVGDPLVEQAGHPLHLPLDLHAQPQLVERRRAGDPGQEQKRPQAPLQAP